MTEAMIEIKNLTKSFASTSGEVTALEDASPVSYTHLIAQWPDAGPGSGAV